MRPMLLASCVLLTTGCLGAGSGQADNRPNTLLPAPTRLDYLLLASLADTRRPLAMAAYSPEPVHDRDE
jgi:hypothetical protein